MGSMEVQVGAKEASIQAIVLRCRCGAPESHHGAVCPSAVSHNLGTISYYHKNPLRRWLFAARNRSK
jgi:hypothetical protein